MFLKDDQNRGLKIAVIVLSVILVLVIGASAGYFIFNAINSSNNESLDNNQGLTPNSNANNQNQNIDTATIATTTDNVASGQDFLKVKWNVPMEIASMGLIKADSQDLVTSTAKYYKVGTIGDGKYGRGDLILLSVNYQGPGMYPNYIYFAKVSGSIYELLKHSDDSSQGNFFNGTSVILDEKSEIKDLEFPNSFTFQGVEFKWQGKVNTFFSLINLKKVFNQPGIGDVYMTDHSTIVNGIASEKDYAAISNINNRNGFYVKAPDGTLRVYSPEPYFAIQSSAYGSIVPKVIWNNGSANTEEYVYTHIGGCGASNYMQVVPSGMFNKDTDFVISGKTNQGDSIYEFKNVNSAYLKNIYNNVYQVNTDEKKMPYDQFVSSHPIFFWYDSFGRLIQFQSNKFVPLAECGKPVIYLYPQQKEIISVKLAPQGGFTYTEPAYNNGWVVEADINSNLRELSSNKTYPYLFWEGRGGIYNAPDKGFVVAQKDVHQFLVNKLDLLGLNKKETADFVEFWEPRMQGSPYYFVSFMGNAVMDQLAPLDISPKPDTIIRVLMDFRPLTQLIQVQGYDIHAPERKGFTVVEWGGVLR